MSRTTRPARPMPARPRPRPWPPGQTSGASRRWGKRAGPPPLVPPQGGDRPGSSADPPPEAGVWGGKGGR
eukprot:5287420-Lingulodinium_polyedra.AAC.1